jgi:serine protease Do
MNWEFKMNLFAQIRESHATSIVAKLFLVAACLGVTSTLSAPATAAQKPNIDSARNLSAAFRSASSQVLDAVVAIESRQEDAFGRGGKPSAENGMQEGKNPFEGSPFEDLFRDQLKRGQPGTPPRHGQSGIGSGVLIHSSGFVLTNNHVVDGADKIIVRLHDGREFKVVDVKTDPKTDLAVLRIEDDVDFPAALLGDSDLVEIGDWVLALGQPFGLESTVTAGNNSAKHRGIGITDRENFLQTDAAINPGNSGGPLVNLDGEVIGINTAISSSSGGNDGIGFAIPVNLAKWVGKQLVSDGKVSRAYLGVGIQPVTAELAKQFHVKPREGVLVNQVHADTPAERAGLKSGDVIVEFSGKAVSNPRELQLSVERADVKKTHALRIVRDGKQLGLSLRPETKPEEFDAKAPASLDADLGQLEKLGLTVDELRSSVAKRLGAEGVQGVLISGVRSGSPAHRQRIEAGSIITHVNHQPIEDRSTLQSALESSPTEEGVLLSVRTRKGSRFVVLKS